jgi:hypothetical protein
MESAAWDDRRKEHFMEIRETLRTLIVDTLEFPVKKPPPSQILKTLKAELDPEPAKHRMTNRRKT